MATHRDALASDAAKERVIDVDVDDGRRFCAHASSCWPIGKARSTFSPARCSTRTACVEIEALRRTPFGRPRTLRGVAAAVELRTGRPRRSSISRARVAECRDPLVVAAPGNAVGRTPGDARSRLKVQ